MRTLGIYVCSNGYGHFVRSLHLAKHLISEFKVTMYIASHHRRLAEDVGINYIVVDDNIRWDEIKRTGVFQIHKHLATLYQLRKEIKEYDIFISDNLTTPLIIRPDTIVSGSFFWSDVLANNSINSDYTDLEQDILAELTPSFITNKYLETGNICSYKNKEQFGFGLEQVSRNFSYKKKLLGILPSLNYDTSYIDFIRDNEIETSPPQDHSNEVYIARPGIGIIEHCYKYKIPLIGLVSKTDSTEILELADRIETLNIGRKCFTDERFNYEKYMTLFIEDIYNNISFDNSGYKKISSYIKSL